MSIRLVAAIIALILATVAGAPAAVADEVDQGPEASPFRVSITELSPELPTATDELVVTATLRNDSDADLRRATLILRVGNAPLGSQEEVMAIADGTVEPSLPIVRYSEDTPVAAGDERALTMRVSFAELGLQSPGAYALSVEAVDVVLGPLAQTATFLAWMPAAAQVEPVDITWLWPIAIPAARDAEDVIVAPDLGAQLAPGGRLRSIVDAASAFTDPFTWVVDAQTLETVEVLSGEHAVLGVRGPEERTGDPAAGVWEQDLLGLLSAPQAEVLAMGYAYPDSTAMVEQGLISDVVLATTTPATSLEERLGRSVGGNFSWAPDGRLNQSTLNVLRGAGVTTVLLDGATVSTDSGSGLAQVATDTGEVTAALADPALTLAAALAATDPSGIASRQLVLAATATTAVRSPGARIVAAPDPQWSPQPAAASALLQATAAAPWLRPVGLTQAIAASDASSSRSTLLDDEAVSELPQDQTGKIAIYGFVLATIGAITTEPSPAQVQMREGLLRSASTTWRAEPQTGVTLVDRVGSQILAAREKVAISTAGTISFPGDSGRVPITVSNDLDVPVEVSVSLTSDPQFRLESESPEALVIPGGQRASLEVPVRVIGSEPVTVAAQLSTPEGNPYGEPEQFTLRTAAYSSVARWVILGALAILAALVVRSVYMRVRSARGKEVDTSG